MTFSTCFVGAGSSQVAINTPPAASTRTQSVVDTRSNFFRFMAPWCQTLEVSGSEGSPFLTRRKGCLGKPLSGRPRMASLPVEAGMEPARLCYFSTVAILGQSIGNLMSGKTKASKTKYQAGPTSFP